MRIIDFFEKGVARGPDAPMFIDAQTGETMSYRAVKSTTDRAAANSAAQVFDEDHRHRMR